MQLDYIVRKERDDENNPYDLHFLVDTDSQRMWGYVEAPTERRIAFVATPYKGVNRWYLTLEAAKGYLEQLVIEQDLEECEALTKNVSVPASSEVPAPAEEKVPTPPQP